MLKLSRALSMSFAHHVIHVGLKMILFLCNLNPSTNLEKAHPDVLLDACLAPNERGVDTVILGDAVDHDFQ